MLLANIQSWGNSQGIRIPKSIMNELKLSNGQSVELIVEDDHLIIRKAAASRKTIKELFDNYNGDYECSEVEWGESVGNEVW